MRYIMFVMVVVIHSNNSVMNKRSKDEESKNDNIKGGKHLCNNT